MDIFINPGKQIIENFSSILRDVLEKGNRSIYSDGFITICSEISLRYLRKSCFYKSILRKEGINEEKIALDLISDLFETHGDKFCILNRHFNKKITEIENFTDEYAFASLVVLIRSRINQRISEIREDYGEIYFKIKKNYESFVSRNHDEISETVFRDVSYVHSISQTDLRLDKEFMSQEILLDVLFGEKFKTHSIPELVRKTINFASAHTEYSAAIPVIALLNSLKLYYESRLKDELIKNADYLNIIEST